MTENQQPEWWYDEGVPGVGPKPDHLEERFGFNQAKQAKAYKDARNELGRLSRLQEAPPEKYDLSQFEDFIEPENPHLSKLLNHAKEARFRQQDVNTIIETLVDYERSFIPDEKQELEKLGPEADKKVKMVEQWLKNGFSEKTLSTVERLPKTAEVIEMLDELRQKQSQDRSTPPSALDHGAVPAASLEDIQNEIFQNAKAYDDPFDDTFRRKINAKLKALYGE